MWPSSAFCGCWDKSWFKFLSQSTLSACGFSSGPSFAVLSDTCVSVLCLTCLRGCRRECEPVYSSLLSPHGELCLQWYHSYLHQLFSHWDFCSRSRRWTWPLIPSVIFTTCAGWAFRAEEISNSCSVQSTPKSQPFLDNPLSLLSPGDIWVWNWDLTKSAQQLELLFMLWWRIYVFL